MLSVLINDISLLSSKVCSVCLHFSWSTPSDLATEPTFLVQSFCLVQETDGSVYNTSCIQLFQQRLPKKKCKSVHDNAKRYSGKYPINFNKSSESILPTISSLCCTVEALWILKKKIMDSELLLKCIGYFPEYLLALLRTLLHFFWKTFCRNSCIL